MRRISAAMMIAIGAACASSPPPPPAPPPAPVVASASTSAPVKPLPTTLLPGVGMSAPPGGGEVEEEEPTGPAPYCGKDEDCWSRTCCPAKAPEECVHASRARKCAIIDITCKPTPIHYTCICDNGTCKGRLAPP